MQAFEKREANASLAASAKVAFPQDDLSTATAVAPVAPLVPSRISSYIRRWRSSDRATTALSGGAWTIVGYAGTQGLRTVTTIVLARHFIGPEQFGVVGLIGVFVAGLSMFSELGIAANIIQHRRGDDQDFLNTAYSIQTARGFTIWLLAALAAYPLAVFYDQPAVLPLLVVAGASEAIRGLTSTAASTLTRQVKLRSLTLLTLASEVVAAIVCIVWAVVSPSAWVLVARTIASAAVVAVGSHFIAQPRVRLGWDKTAVNEILHFGGWISVATATYFLAGQGERLMLGKLITPAELGCFSMAVMISSMPAAAINQLVNQIALPMISRSARISQAAAIRDFLYSRRVFFAGALVTALGSLACGKLFVRLLLPPKYEMTGWMLQALGVRVALDMFAAPASTVLLAYGRSKYSAAASAVRLVLMVSGVWYSFVYFGIHQAVLSLIVAQIVSYFPMIAGLSMVLPDVALPELRWYTGFVVLISIAAAFSWLLL